MIKTIMNQKGVALIAVIFILVVMGGIGIAVSKITQNQASNAVNTLQVQNAFYSANAGIDWAWQQAKDATPPFNNLTVDIPATLKTLPNGDTFTVTYVAATDTLTSTSSRGLTARGMTFKTFKASAIPGGGGGGGPNATCTAVSDPTGAQTMFQTATAAGATGVVQNTPVAPIVMPAAAAATPPGLTFAGNKTFIGVNTLPAVGTTANFINITGAFLLKQNASLTINGPTTPGSALTVYIGAGGKLDNNTRLNITGNVRFVTTGNFKIEQGSRVNIAAGGNLLMMNTSTFTVDNNALINSAGTAANMLIMSQGLVDIKKSSVTNAGIYTTGSVKINIASVNGAIVSAGPVTVTNSRVTPNTTVATSVINNVPAC